MIIKEDLDSPARALRDVADDLAALNGAVGAVTAPAAPDALTSAAPAALTAATVATANGSDPTTTQALANALKVELNKVIADNVAARTEQAALQADIAALRTKLAAVITALDDVEAGSTTLKTTKG